MVAHRLGMSKCRTSTPGSSPVCRNGGTQCRYSYVQDVSNSDVILNTSQQTLSRWFSGSSVHIVRNLAEEKFAGFKHATFRRVARIQSPDETG